MKTLETQELDVISERALSDGASENLWEILRDVVLCFI
jgi:hypothetical protein